LFSYGCDLVPLTRRQYLALTGFALANACRTRKGTGFAGYALVSNAGGRALSVVDLTQFRVARSISLAAPASKVLPASKSGCFVLTPSNGSVALLDPELRVIKSRRFSDDLSDISLSPDGETVLATSADKHELIVARATSLDVLRRVKLSGEPVSMTVPPLAFQDEKTKPPYVALSTKQGAVELLDLKTGRHFSHSFSGPVGEVRFRADGERLLAANLQERCLTALTTPDLNTIAELPLAMQPKNLCFNADQGQLFVSGEGMDAVAIIFPYNPLDVDQTVLAGRDPGVMACSANPAYLFVGSASGSDVCILNIDSRKMIGIVDAGQRPTYIAVTPDSQYALVLAQSSGTMAVIHIPDVLANAGNAAKWRSKITAGLFTLLNVGDQPVHVAVVPRQAA
jgi:DNA-binding beta-propeller fold protein YncE